MTLEKESSDDEPLSYEEKLFSMATDLMISRGAIKAFLPESEGYKFHKGRITYLENFFKQIQEQQGGDLNAKSKV